MHPKKPQNRYQKKAQDIQKSLVHRARLRKAYFKLLEKEGGAVPKREGSKEDDREHKQADSGNENEEENTTQTPGNKPIKYRQRMQLVHERRKRKNEEKKHQAIKEALNRKNEREARKKLRLKHKSQMTKYTPKGQPLMRGRISRLLDKIKDDS